MDINDQKGPKIDQLSIIHLLFKKFLWFFDFYVVGQGDQHNDKVGQGDQLMEIVGQESFTPPTRADFGAALCVCVWVCTWDKVTSSPAIVYSMKHHAWYGNIIAYMEIHTTDRHIY